MRWHSSTSRTRARAVYVSIWFVWSTCLSIHPSIYLSIQSSRPAKPHSSGNAACAPDGDRLARRYALGLGYGRMGPHVDMDTREFGHTGLHVTPITLGSWPMSGDRYGRIDDAEAVGTIHRALDEGITSFDTAPGYGSGHAEETLGAALVGRRDQAVIITK